MNRLRVVRREMQMAIIGLAAKSGISATTICGIEKWDYLPRLSTRSRIAVALNVAISEIWPDAPVPVEPMTVVSRLFAPTSVQAVLAV